MSVSQQSLWEDELFGRYPQLKETRRERDWVEMQTELAPCVALITVFVLPDEKLDSLGYAFTCP